MKADLIKNNNIIFSGLKMFKDVTADSVMNLSDSKKVKSTILTMGRLFVQMLYNRSSNLYKRYQLLNNFSGKLIKMNKNHGTEYTLKFLKANQLAIQKKIAGQPFSSLRDVEPNLPLPRLSKAGLPIWISPKDRSLILNDSYLVIRLWLTLFGIYRIFKSPPKGQIMTIIDPFKGNYNYLYDFNTWLKLYGKSILLNQLPFKPTIQDIEVKEINWLLTSGPVGKVSYKEIFSSLYSFSCDKVLLNCLKQYLLITNSVSFRMILRKLGVIARDLEGNANLIRDDFLKKEYRLIDKDNPLGRLSFKEEPNGKVRVFAIVDVITQSLFTPLHNLLFKICKSLPTDSLYDQDQAFKRCLSLSLEKGCSFGFDLSAATDRLPIDNQAQLLNVLFDSEVGSWWSRLLTWRDFVISANNFGINSVFNSSMKVRYSVGQPMGALSSWAMLNLIHHMMVQYSYWLTLSPSFSKGKINNFTWFMDYQILGDDLVIFNKEVALKYLFLCRMLGVRINEKKSIISENRAVCEFAKRTGLNGKDVSAISFKELISLKGSFFSKLSLFTTFYRKGYIKNSKYLNVLTIASKTANVKKQFPWTYYVAWIMQQIKKGSIGYTFEGLGPYLNDQKDTMHYFGKSISSIDKQGLTKYFLSFFDKKVVAKPSLKGERVYWAQEQKWQMVLLYQYLFKANNLFFYRDRFVQWQDGFINSFGFITEDKHKFILARVYKDQFLSYYEKESIFCRAIVYDIWKSIPIIELMKMIVSLDSVVQKLGFFNFSKTKKTNIIENPFKDFWFMHNINAKGPKNLMKAIEIFRGRGMSSGYARPSLTIGSLFRFNFSNLQISMDQGFKDTFFPSTHLKSDPKQNDGIFKIRKDRKKSYLFRTLDRIVR